MLLLWEKRKESLERTIEGMRKSGITAAEIDPKEEELAAVEEKLKAKWFLQYREQMCDMEKFRVGKYSVCLLQYLIMVQYKLLKTIISFF